VTAYDRGMRELLEECRSSAFDAKEYSLCDRIDAALRTPIPPIFDAFCTAREQRDEARAEIERLRDFIESLIDERDEARAEVERLKASYDAVCRERNQIQTRFSILSKRWIGYRSVELLRQVEWVTDGRESTTSCLFCHRSHTQGHAADCDAFGRIGGAVPPDVVEYASHTEEDK